VFLAYVLSYFEFVIAVILIITLWVKLPSIIGYILNIFGHTPGLDTYVDVESQREYQKEKDAQDRQAMESARQYNTMMGNNL